MSRTILFSNRLPRVRRSCKSTLEADGYRVVLAEDGIDALNALDTIPVDLVVLEQHSPRCRGLDAAEKIRQCYPRVPIILYTADPDYEEFTSPFVDDSVIKTGDFHLLQRSVARLLAGGHQGPRASRPVNKPYRPIAP